MLSSDNINPKIKIKYWKGGHIDNIFTQIKKAKIIDKK